MSEVDKEVRFRKFTMREEDKKLPKITKVIWVKSGEHARWIAKALAGAFQRALVIDNDRFNTGVVISISEMASAQGIMPIAIIEDAEEKFRMKGGVYLDSTDGPFEKRDQVVEEMLEWLKKEKWILPL